MTLSFINIRKVPREILKTSGFALGFQHLPRDLANVNEWKIMFDPMIDSAVEPFREKNNVIKSIREGIICLFALPSLKFSAAILSIKEALYASIGTTIGQ